MLLGVIDYWFVPEMDLRLVNLLLAGFVAWVAVRAYDTRRLRAEALADEEEPEEHPGWVAVRGGSQRD